MNKVYKVIWNKAKHCYEVVSELAKSQGKSSQDKRASRISMRAAAVLAAFLVTIGGGTINFVQAADTTAQVQVKAEQKAAKAADAKLANAKTAGEDSVAIGDGAEAGASNGKQSVAVGVQSHAGGSQAVAVGYQANSWGTSTAIGANAVAQNKNSVALGTNSKTSGDYEVSVGGVEKVDDGKGGTKDQTFTRKITNVTAGSFADGSHDAITGGQLAAAGIVTGKVQNSQNGIALGKNNVHTENSMEGIAIGSDNTAVSNANQGIALGGQATVVSTAKGLDGKTLNYFGGVAIGGDSHVINSNMATAIGAKSKVESDDNTTWNSVALGAQSYVGKDDIQDSDRLNGHGGVISVGSSTDRNYGQPAFTRRIINVSDGINDSDAATVGQVKAGFVSYGENKNDSINTGSVTFKGTTQKFDGKDVNVGTKLNNVNDISFNVPVYETEADKYAPKADPSIGSYGLITETGTLAGYESRSLAGAGLLPGKVSGELDTTGKGYNVALGRTTSIDGAHAGAIAVGKDATVVFDDKFNKEPNKGTESPNDAISIGTRTKNYNSFSGVALGASSGTWQSNWGTALGTDSHVDNSYYGTAAGVFAKVENSAEGLALGRSAYVKGAPGSVALGSKSVADESGVISVGHKADDLRRDGKPYGDDLKRRITNVADGVNDFDAVNKKQLNAVDTKVTGLSDSAVQYDKNENGTTNYGSVTFKGAGKDVGTNLKNIGTISAANGWFSLNENGKLSTYDLVLSDGDEYNSFKDAGLVAGKVTAPASYNTFDNLVIGSGAKIDNMDTENGFAKQNTAVGNKAQILPGWEWGEDSEGKAPAKRGNSVSGSSAFGAGAQVTGNNSSAFGFNANVVNDLGVAIGYNAKAGKSSSKDDDGKATAIGAESNAGGNRSTALGYHAQATVDEGTAVGYNTNLGYGTEGSVALGARSVVTKDDLLKDDAGNVTETNGVVSVGDSNYGTNSKDSFQRRIINVADGVNKFDAVNKGQLDAVDTKVTGLSDSAVQYDKTTDGKVNTNSVTFGGTYGTILNNVGDIKFYTSRYANNTMSFKEAGITPGLKYGKNVTDDNVVLGPEARISGYDQVDKDSKASVGESVVIGNNAQVYAATQSTAIGGGATVYSEHGTALGNGARVGNDTGASVSLGADSNVDKANLLADGSESLHGVVSVGKSGDYAFTRRIINVTDGRVMKGSHDAVTGQQLFAEQEARTDADKGFTGKFTAYENAGVKAGVAVKNGIALGDGGAAGENGTTVGVSATAEKGATALGHKAYAAENSVALGNNAVTKLGVTNAVVLGTNSVATESNTVSVGSKDNRRKITNVADGVADTDAATVGQISKITGTDSEKGAVVQYDKNEKGTTNYDSITFKGSNGTVLNKVADIALTAYKGHNSTFVGSGLVNGVVYDTTSNSLWTENGSEKTSSIAIGRDSNVRGTSSLAVGIGATVGTGDNSTVIANGTALGTNAKAGGQNGTAVGEEAEVAGDNGAAFGYQAKAEADSTAIGTNATAGYNGAGEAVAIGKSANVQYKQGIALGNKAEVLAEQGTALGYGAQITWNGKNSVALGAGSIANEEDVVSVGRAAGQGGNVSNPAITRRIVNVAAGVNDTDAVNKGQMDAAIKNAGLSTDQDGNVNVGGNQTGKLNLNKDGSASLTNNKGDKGFFVDKDGNNTIKGNTTIDGTLTFQDANGNKDTVATGTDVSGIKKEIGVNADGTYKTIDNGAANVIDGINKNTAAINTNTAAIKTNKDNIGATGDNDALKLKNGEKTIEAGINKNTADIANNAAAIQQNKDNIMALGGAVSELDTRVDRVGAGAAALAALHPLDYDPANKWDFAAGYGHYKGANAVSVGTYYRPNENTMFSVGGSFGGGENMVNAGVSFKLGGGSGVTTSRTAMAAEINSLKDSNKTLADNNKVLTDKVAAQDKKLADYDQKMKDMEAKLEQLLKAQKQ